MAVRLLRVDANAAIGYGHLARMATLADELARRGHTVWFASQDRLDQTHWFHSAWRFLPLEAEHDLHLVAESLQPDAIVCDLPAYDAETLALLRAQYPLIVLDDFQAAPLPADLLIYTQMIWREAPADSGQRVLGGPRYALIPRRVAETPRVPPTRDLVVTLGGSDPTNLTARVLEGLRALEPPVTMTVILGPGYHHRESLCDLLESYPHAVSVRAAVTDMISVMKAHRLAVTAVGVTLYELAACGVPAIALAEEARHMALATVLESVGTLRALPASQAEVGSLAAEVACLLADSRERAAMAEAGRALLDGNGPARIADAMERLILRRQASTLTLAS